MIEPQLTLPGVEVYIGDAKETVMKLAEKYGGKVNMVCTSPPYKGLRRYLPPGHPDADKEIGQELTVEEYIASLCDLFDAIGRNLLTETGSLWINQGDSYAGSGGAGGDYAKGGLREGQPKWKPPKSDFPAKCLQMVPERFALEMIRRGWILRNRVIWFKGKDVDDPLDDDDGGAPASNGMPTSVEDRLKNTYEVVFHFTKQQRYFYDLNAIREPLIHPEAVDGTRMFGGANKHDGYGTRTHSGNPYGRRNGTVPTGLENDETKGQPSGIAGASPLGRNPGDLWAIPTTPFPLAHFATYPPALVHRPAKTTCPEAVCIKCGTPRQAIYETKEIARARPYRNSDGRHPRREVSSGQMDASDKTGLNVIKGAHIIGYTDCECNVGWGGAVVLDPFFGSGSTAQGVFEARLPVTIDGHYCQPLVIGIDLDERNLSIIEKRLTGRAKQSRKIDYKQYGGGLFELLEDDAR